MDRQEFIEVLKSRNIPINIVCFDELNGRDGVIWIRKIPYEWSVSHIERGQEYNWRGFQSESDALKYSLETIIEEYVLLNKQP